MTNKLLPKIDVFDKLANTARLRAEGIGPADRKPKPRPPLPPSTVMPARKNPFEGKTEPKNLTPEERKKMREMVSALEGVKPEKRKEVRERIEQMQKLTPEQQKQLKIMMDEAVKKREPAPPSMSVERGTGKRDLSEKEEGPYTKMVSDYFKKEKEAPNPEAFKAELRKKKEEQAKQLQDWVSKIRERDPEANKKLQEKKHRELFQPSFLESGEEVPAPEITEPVIDAESVDSAKIDWYKDALTKAPSEVIIPDGFEFYSADEFFTLSALLNNNTSAEKAALKNDLKTRGIKFITSRKAPPKPQGELAPAPSTINKEIDPSKFIDTGPEVTSPKRGNDLPIRKFIAELTDNELDIYTGKQLRQLMEQTNIPMNDIEEMLAQKGKYLVKGLNPESGEQRTEFGEQKGLSKIWLPMPIIEQASKLLDMDSVQPLIGYLNNLPQEDMPRSVNELVEKYLHDRTDFYEPTE